MYTSDILKNYNILSTADFSKFNESVKRLNDSCKTFTDEIKKQQELQHKLWKSENDPLDLSKYINLRNWLDFPLKVTSNVFLFLHNTLENLRDTLH